MKHIKVVDTTVYSRSTPWDRASLRRSQYNEKTTTDNTDIADGMSEYTRAIGHLNPRPSVKSVVLKIFVVLLKD